jgi:hypothetical protein
MRPDGGGTTDLPVTRAGHPTAPGRRGTATLDRLTFPLVIAHRGGANLFPENTLAAYEGAAALRNSGDDAAAISCSSLTISAPGRQP